MMNTSGVRELIETFVLMRGGTSENSNFAETVKEKIARTEGVGTSDTPGFYVILFSELRVSSSALLIA
jgi:hypothetical protein